MWSEIILTLFIRKITVSEILVECEMQFCYLKLNTFTYVIHGLVRLSLNICYMDMYVATIFI